MLKNKLADYERCEHKDGWIVWYEKESDEIVCTLSLTKYNGQMWIGAVYVAPTYRGNGMCRALLDFATFNGGDHLAVRKTNIPALTAYRNYGFKTYDEDETNYFMRYEDTECETIR